MNEPEDLMARLRESIDQHKRRVTSSAQTPEPTDEQRAVAMEVAGWWPLTYAEFERSVQQGGDADDLDALDHVNDIARALAAQAAEIVARYERSVTAAVRDAYAIGNEAGAKGRFDLEQVEYIIDRIRKAASR